MKKVLYIIPVLLLSLAACKKDYLETRPTGAELESTVYSRFSAVQATLQGLYKNLYSFGNAGGGRHDDFGQKGFDLTQDLMGNDMVVHSQGYGWFNTSYNYTEYSAVTTSRTPDAAWVRYYSM